MQFDIGQIHLPMILCLSSPLLSCRYRYDLLSLLRRDDCDRSWVMSLDLSLVAVRCDDPSTRYDAKGM